MKSACLTLFLCSIAVFSFAQAGTLDETFGDGGKVTARKDNSYEQFFQVRVQADGKIIGAGQIAIYSGAGTDFKYNFLLIRYNSNGSVDKTFGKNGKVTTDFKKGDDTAMDFIIQPDGKIVVVGKTRDPANTKGIDFAIARYESNGALDSSFASYGKVIIDFDKRYDEAKAVALQADGKIVITGSTINYEGAQDSYVALARLNINGSTDTSFGIQGKVIATDFSGAGNLVSDVAIQPDQKILVSGSAQQTFTSNYSFLTVRYNNTGVLDSSFGTNGKVWTDFGNYGSYCTAMMMQPDGKIILTGYTFLSNSANLALTRYNNSGTIDSSFGINGKTTTDFNNAEETGRALAIQNDGKILVAGRILYNTDFSLLVRYNENGKLDNTFGLNGRVRNFSNSYADAIALQPDNKIITAGVLYTTTPTSDVLLIRYNNETVLPITLSYFSATKKQNSLFLNWQTASENNNSYFSIERSNNNSNFKELGKVNSKGNSTQVLQYSFEDKIPLSGANYYRLKQVNKDGTATTSKTVLVDFSKAAVIKLYPNPVKNVITIEGLTGNKTAISIIDLNGRVLTTTSTNDATYTWNIKTLPQGTYYLRTEADKKVSTVKFVKE